MFYDKYAQLCKQRGVSMSAAAVDAGVSKSLVTKWKVNKVEVPSPDVLKKLSVYFDIPVSELLGEENKKEKPTAPKDDGLSEEKREVLLALYEGLKALSVDDLQAIGKVVAAISNRASLEQHHV